MSRREIKRASRAARRAGQRDTKEASKRFWSEVAQPQLDWVNQRSSELRAEGLGSDEAHRQAQAELPEELKAKRPAESVFKDMTDPEMLAWADEQIRLAGRKANPVESMIRVTEQIGLEIEMLQTYELLVKSGVLIPLEQEDR